MRVFQTLMGAAAIMASAALTAGPAAADFGAPSCGNAAAVAVTAGDDGIAACGTGAPVLREQGRSAPALAQRAVKCRRVCAQRVRECQVEQRCNYVTGKCRNVQVCTTRCSYYEDRPLGCDP